jgi:hypothetical protein
MEINDTYNNMSAYGLMKIQTNDSSATAKSVKLHAITEKEALPASNLDSTMKLGEKAAAAAHNQNTEEVSIVPERLGGNVDTYA